MDFLDLQNEVIQDRFDQSKRPSVKNWLNHRYGRLWGAEDWSFKYVISPLTAAGSSTSVAIPAGMGDILAIWDMTISPSYAQLTPMRPENLWDVASQTSSGAAYDFTLIGSTIYFERPLNQDSTFQVLGELKFVPMAEDTDPPLIPEEFHLTIAQGATSHGLRLENDPSWQGFEQDWQAGIEDMKKQYLASLRPAYSAYPSWP